VPRKNWKLPHLGAGEDFRKGVPGRVEQHSQRHLPVPRS
jgi:hypothetical protein